MATTGSDLEDGLRLHDGGEFMAAHRALERAWLAAGGPQRQLLQGLVQLSAAGVHLERGRCRPALRLLERAEVKLAAALAAGTGLPDGPDVAALHAAVGRCLRELRRGSDTPPDPHAFLPRFGTPGLNRDAAPPAE